ncbi:MAG: nickel-responsive transcriptional regulator NikR, partial [Candidatus Bathyarchaeia archaeon]
FSIPRGLLRELEEVMRAKGYKKRSKVICDAIRNYLAEYRWSEGEGREVVAVISLLYDHELRGASETVIRAGHEHGPLVISTMHIHLDERNCLEVMATRGSPREIRKFAEGLVGMRGVKQLKLSVMSP